MLYSYCVVVAPQAIFIPLMFDLASELSFGIAPEGTVLTGLTLGNNLIGLLGLLAPADSFFAWVNWTNAGLAVAAALLLGVWLPTTLPKFDYDQAQNITDVTTATAQHNPVQYYSLPFE